MRPSELVQVRGEQAFVPSFYREVASYLASSCPADFSSSSTATPGVFRCDKQKDYYVAGVEQVELEFNYYFIVLPKFNSLSFGEPPGPMKAHSAAFHSRGWDVGLRTVLLNPDGTVRRDMAAGTSVTLTVQELLDAAYFEDGDTNLGLDSTFQPEGETRDLPIRLTGVAVNVDIWISSTGMCEMHQSNTMTQVPIEHVGPLACLSVYAQRRWVTETVEQPVGVSGVRSRQTNGVQVRFRKLGSLEFVDEQAMLRGITCFIIWAQLPVLLIAWFISNSLGRLSYIYSALVHQEIDLGSSIKGFAVRLLHYSSAFMCLRGKTGTHGGADGITKKCIAERVAKICEGQKMDDMVVVDAVDVIFDSLKSYKKENAKKSKVVTCQEFVAACTTNEPITLETMVKIFDKDRALGKLEALFLDEALAQVREAAMQDEGAANEEEEVTESTPKEAEADASHSRIVQAYRDVQSLFKDLFKVEFLALQAAKDLDVNPSRLGLVPNQNSGDKNAVPKVPASTPLPKMTRSVSKDSVGDEGSPLKRDFRDIER